MYLNVIYEIENNYVPMYITKQVVVFVHCSMYYSVVMLSGTSEQLITTLDLFVSLSLNV